MSFARLVLLAGFVAAGQDPAPPVKSEWEQMADQAGYPIMEALDLGIREGGDGFLYRARLDTKRGALVYQIDIAKETTMVRVVLDAKTGELIDTREKLRKRSDQVPATAIDLREVIKDAQTEGARVIDARLRDRNGRPYFDVRSTGKSGDERFRIDGLTGGEWIEEAARRDPFNETFEVDKDDLGPNGENPYFILEPGVRLVLEGQEGEAKLRLTIEVLRDTKWIDDVETRVVEERLARDDETVQVIRGFFTISQSTRNVYCFGEEVEIHRNGEIADEGSNWLSGEDEARFGLEMPGTPLLGGRYYHMTAPKIAMDRAEILSLSEAAETPYEKYEETLKVDETTPIKNFKQTKWYARGVGLIRAGDLRLTDFSR